MDKPEDKKPPTGPLRPPHPAPPGKKAGAPLPKGPVPPRGPSALPGMPGAAAQPPAPGRPAMPPAGVPPMGGAPRPPMGSGPATPPMQRPLSTAAPGAPVVPPAAAPQIPPAFAEAEAAQTELQKKITDLEKKLLEEREKVLLASLRSKEEEAVSAKVETSIKEIQDKLRRERKEQELEEARHKAEARVAEMERRIAEEREAWVSTLKGQLGQRDQVTQEMEMHFSSRLKDLEYRWAQEKATLETALREREGDMARLRQESALKSEQEKAFWEDRVKTIAGEREKIDREFERLRDKTQTEKELLNAERQNLKDQIFRLESTVKLMEDQQRVEKAAFAREAEASSALARHEAAIQKESLEKQLAVLNLQLQNNLRDLQEKSGQIETLNQQLALFRGQLGQSQSRLGEIDELRNKMVKMDDEYSAKKKEFQSEIEALTRQLSETKAGMKEVAAKAREESEERIKVLQGRVDWYDANIRREYDQARDKVQKHVEDLERELKTAKDALEQVQSSEMQRAGILEGAQKAIEELKSEKSQLESELESQRSEWKQVQWDMEARLKEAVDHLKAEQLKTQQHEESKLALEQELRQRGEYIESLKADVEKRQYDVDRFRDRFHGLEKAIELEREKTAQLEKQAESYKSMLHGQGLQATEELRAELQEKTAALEKAKESLRKTMMDMDELQKKDDIFKEKEKALRQMMADKDDALSELKNQTQILSNKLSELSNENTLFRESLKKERESAAQIRKDEFEELQRQRKEDVERVLRQKNQEIEQAKRVAADEALEKFRAELPPAPNSQQLASQIRQQVESEMMERLRQVESDSDARVAQAKEEAKKEMDKIKWEHESQKEELKKARQARAQLEREAQQIIQQAEDHYRRELTKARNEAEKSSSQKNRGFFTALGRILDTPIIDTNKNKQEEDK